MKIVLIDPSLFTWPYDNKLVQGLAGEGDEVALYGKYLALDEPGKGAPYYREWFYPFLQLRTFQTLPKPLFMLIKGLSHIWGLTKLWHEFRRAKPDIIHFQWVPLPVVDRLFLPFFRRIAPVILTVHDSAPFNDNPRSRLQQVGALKILRHFDRLIVHTEQAKNKLISYGIDANRIARIPHGLLSSHAPILAALSPESPVVLLLFGKLKPYKGADILIQALAAMPPPVREYCRLHIIGKSYMDEKQLFELARKLGIERHILWDLRFVNEGEMAGIFTQASVIVLPYRQIDASGVLMAALEAGRPIVASRIGLFAEMLEDGRHGYLVAPEDVQGLAHALTRLVEDKKLREAMGSQVLALKNTIPDWRAIAQMTKTLYREILEN